MPKVTGPKDGEVITASFDVLNKKKNNSKSLFPSLKTTKDLVLLSIKGNEYCTGEYLGAIVQQAVATHQTALDYVGAKGKTTFLVADEIYWHNIKELINSTEDIVRLKDEALKMGEDYIRSNLEAFLTPLGMTVDQFNSEHPPESTSTDEIIEIINQLADKLGKNFEIVRWKTWVAQNDSQEKINTLMKYYDTVDGLKVSINNAKMDYVQRHCKDGKYDLWSLRSNDYLTEESPAVMWLAASLGYNFVIYPGDILPSFAATKEFFVVREHAPYISDGMNIIDECKHNEHCLHVKDPARLVNWLEVNFKRSHAPKVASTSINNEIQGDTLPVGKPNTEVSQVSFFSPRKRSKVDERDLLLEGDYMITSYNPKELSAILEGIGKGLIAISGKQRGKPTPENAELSDIFAGITKGILETSLPPSEKIGYLVNIIKGVTEATHEKPEEMALSLSSQSSYHRL